MTRPTLPAAVVLVTVTVMATVAAPGPAAAQVEAVQFATAQQEKLYRDLLRELRCLVCANQSLSDSNADLAGDLRARVYEMVAAGQSRAAIVDFMVARYGDYVLYRPRLSAATWFLWFAPFVLAAAGMVFVLLLSRGRHRAPPLTEAQTAQARRLLDGGDGDGDGGGGDGDHGGHGGDGGDGDRGGGDRGDRAP
ncbi:MAG: cytochrome c-type biogenesis protein CcmH [Gammaproteobacteria bacterium]|nr:cytochrome c-type biogenesis protein CcmH [Gammaproteobacteria bacterium]